MLCEGVDPPAAVDLLVDLTAGEAVVLVEGVDVFGLAAFVAFATGLTVFGVLLP